MAVLWHVALHMEQHTMPKAPTYLTRNRDGLYHFRIRIPDQVTMDYGGKRYLVKSLATHNRRHAIGLARRLAVVAHRRFERQMAKRHKESHQHKTGWLMGLFGKIDHGGDSSPEGARLEQETLMKQLEWASANPELATAMSQIQQPAPPAEEKPGPKLSELYSDFLAHKIRNGKWKQDDDRNIRRAGQFQDMIDIIGDLPANRIGRKEAEALVDGLRSYPTERRTKWQGIPLEQIPHEAPRLSESSADQRLVFYKGFFKWAVETEVVQRNPLDGLSIPYEPVHHAHPSQRDLEAWFNLDNHLITKAWQFWIPRIGLFQAMRLNEIAQLQCKDVYQDNGYWIFDINKNDGKGVKNRSSVRKIPIHSALINNGFLDYHEGVRASGSDSLWPSLTPKQGNWGYRVGSYWRDLRDKHNVLENGGIKPDGTQLVFHSLRRVLIEELENVGVDGVTTDSISGHKPTMGTRKAYKTGIRTLHQKSEAIEKLKIEGIGWQHPLKFNI